MCLLADPFKGMPHEAITRNLKYVIIDTIFNTVIDFIGSYS